MADSTKSTGQETNQEGQLVVHVTLAELEKLMSGQGSGEVMKAFFEGKPLNQTNDPDKPLSQAEAAKFLGVTRQYFYNMRRRGELRSYKLGNRVVFFRKDLLALLKEC